MQGLKSGPGGKPRAPISPPKLTTLFSRAGAPPAFEVRENRCETTDMAGGLAAYVRSSGLPQQATVRVISQDHGVEKPDIRIFDVAAAEVGCEPDEVVMVGDSLPNDVRGAQNTGWRAI